MPEFREVVNTAAPRAAAAINHFPFRDTKHVSLLEGLKQHPEYKLLLTPGPIREKILPTKGLDKIYNSRPQCNSNRAVTAVARGGTTLIWE